MKNIELIYFLILLVLLYFLTIKLIQILIKEDTVNARKFLWSFVKDCLPFFDNPVTCYPVLLGIDEYMRPHADIIEKEFDSLHKVYEGFYLADCFVMNDTIHYKLKVDNPIKELSEKDLVTYLEAMFNNIFQRFIHKNYPDHKAVSNLVAIQVQEGFVSILVARNENGTKMIQEHKQKQRAFYNESHKQDASIDESWDDV